MSGQAQIVLSIPGELSISFFLEHLLGTADMSRGTGPVIPWFPLLCADGVTLTSVAGAAGTGVTAVHACP